MTQPGGARYAPFINFYCYGAFMNDLEKRIELVEHEANRAVIIVIVMTVCALILGGALVSATTELYEMKSKQVELLSGQKEVRCGTIERR
ncbi:MAG: hypothetical protein HQL86_06960 [Magnetococcales bacterium]|nr:hypothetical protein [Magnetococcales bacterium]